ncbi:methionine sulfoxide reductase A [Thioalkalivibrio nitratireducens DSM 14787]|uniref:Methionine sulfoxide reductase A n=1 Tax=Thioalkalivibrio nitratireducens (strain DSM 14787 / UNIQEM 213 / ALEN2) TaxID=1255043 RepID=L0DUR2_THIND|nr:GIY-YIG nuclease family protein [Thioalkalivibrio nitratireducens]AGA32730.1 methionine sulfoxide reductase A [Thioalkalivibrio nitratireducens DSM 14787]
MTQGRSIRLFLVDGTPHGLLTAEIMNWTGHVLTGPRGKLSELVQRPECGRTGVYFLVGPDAENSARPQVYIGESDDVAKRLKQHNRTEEQGGKDFWEKVCLITSKDQNLTKAHVKYLESLLIQQAHRVGRCILLNGTRHDYIGLPEADQADMAFFLEQIRTVLPVLGFEFLRDASRTPSREAVEGVAGDGGEAAASPRFRLSFPKYGITAHGQDAEGEFFVLEGSQARAEWVAPGHHYQRLHQQLREEGVLVEDGSGLLRFSRDYAFSSPSAAAAMVVGRAANGRTEWKHEETGQTYGEWQDQVVSVAASPEEQ